MFIFLAGAFIGLLSLPPDNGSDSGNRGELLLDLFDKLAAENEKQYLVEKLWERIKPEENGDKLIAGIMKLAESTLGVAASSVLLLDDDNQRLYFRYSNGAAGPMLRRLHISRQSGIAGWIVRNRKPLIVNDPEKNESFYKHIDTITGFKTVSIIGAPIIIDTSVAGVIEALNKNDGKVFNREDLKALVGISDTVARALESVKLNEELAESYKGTVQGIISLADSRDITGDGHSRRVTDLVMKAARELELTARAQRDIEYAALLHDVGKLGVPERIINKAEDLTREEWIRIRKHPITGYMMLREIPLLKEASRLVLHHHERYDGRGYPEGLKGEEIPFGSRLIAAADAYDYMTTGHAHREAMSNTRAYAELTRNCREQFCPVAVKALGMGMNSL